MSGFWVTAVLMLAMGQTGPVATGSRPAELTPQEAVKRDALLQPGVDAMKKNDPLTALTAFHLALAEFPKDIKTLRYSGFAAMAAHRDEEALGLFKRVLAEHPADGWATRLEIMAVEARLGQWAEFDGDLAALKVAKKGDDPELKSPGFIVDEFEVNGTRVRVAFFPLLAGRYHTLYRFLLPEPVKVDMAASTQTGGDRCKDPKFQPYLDVESDDVDQGSFKTQHPELAAKGERSYSLDTYPAACSQGLIKFYPDGEPKYEAVREDVIKALSGAGKR